MPHFSPRRANTVFFESALIFPWKEIDSVVENSTTEITTKTATPWEETGIMSKQQVTELLTAHPKKWRMFQKKQVWIIENSTPLPPIHIWPWGNKNLANLMQLSTLVINSLQDPKPNTISSRSLPRPSKWHVPSLNILPHIGRPRTCMGN